MSLSLHKLLELPLGIVGAFTIRIEKLRGLIVVHPLQSQDEHRGVIPSRFASPTQLREQVANLELTNVVP